MALAAAPGGKERRARQRAAHARILSQDRVLPEVFALGKPCALSGCRAAAETKDSLQQTDLGEFKPSFVCRCASFLQFLPFQSTGMHASAGGGWQTARLPWRFWRRRRGGRTGPGGLEPRRSWWFAGNCRARRRQRRRKRQFVLRHYVECQRLPHREGNCSEHEQCQRARQNKPAEEAP